jgi:hypothetical protein
MLADEDVDTPTIDANPNPSLFPPVFRRDVV